MLTSIAQAGPVPAAAPAALDAAVCARALEARDPRFDGVFYVGIRTTMIYCRPICPSRLSRPDRRRYFDSPAAAEREGYRPCLRCRPELAPGRAVVDAVPRVALTAARRISAGALNGRTVGDLAAELGVGERHLRRAMERELGVTPLELAQTQRLLMAKTLLTDTPLPVTQVAYASGFQSLRRFNAVFRERYRLAPGALRRQRPRAAGRGGEPPAELDGTVRLRLPYRAPMAWDALLRMLAAGALPGVEAIEGSRYGRTVAVGGARGFVLVADGATGSGAGRLRRHAPDAWLAVEVSMSLLPALMPLLARLRHLFDTEAEPGVIDAHLARAGLGTLVARRRGLRVPGAFDGFEGAMRELLPPGEVAGRVVTALGGAFDSGRAGLDRLFPAAELVRDAGAPCLESLGVPESRAAAIVAVAGAVAGGTIRLDPGVDFGGTADALVALAGLDRPAAAAVAMRALHWPDAFPEPDAWLQRAAGAGSPIALYRMAEDWRPWRSYAAAHLTLEAASAAAGRAAVPA